MNTHCPPTCLPQWGLSRVPPPLSSSPPLFRGHSGLVQHPCVGTAPLQPGILSFAVGGLQSPWRGDYREPRPPPPNQASYQEALHAQPRELSSGDTTGGAPELQPPLPPEPPEPNKSPTLNLSEEESGTWEPLPLSSLDPSPGRNPSSPERKTTFPEQELQQLEIGTDAHTRRCTRRCTRRL